MWRNWRRSFACTTHPPTREHTRQWLGAGNLHSPDQAAKPKGANRGMGNRIHRTLHNGLLRQAWSEMCWLRYLEGCCREHQRGKDTICESRTLARLLDRTPCEQRV